MKTPEDEAFDDLARKQGAWGGGYQAKRQAAMDKVNSDFDAEYKKMHEDRAMYGTSWSKDGERIDPMSVYLDEPAQDGKCKLCVQCLERLIRIMGTFDLATGHADTFDELLNSLESELRDVLGYYRQSRRTHER
jgi:hypothetical protein